MSGGGSASTRQILRFFPSISVHLGAEEEQEEEGAAAAAAIIPPIWPDSDAPSLRSSVSSRPVTSQRLCNATLSRGGSRGGAL